jgi:hypothetical protein
MFERVTDMISGFGFEVEDEDNDFIRLCIDSAKEYILDYCNLNTLPPNLISACAELACGKYLKKKLAMGELENADFDMAVQSLQEGDVNISYNTDKSSRNIFIDIVENLNDISERLIRYRKINW